VTANEIPPHLGALATQATDLVKRGDTINSVIEFVHQRSGGWIGTVWVIRQTLGIGLRETSLAVPVGEAVSEHRQSAIRCGDGLRVAHVGTGHGGQVAAVVVGQGRAARRRSGMRPSRAVPSSPAGTAASSASARAASAFVW
jgi:hypothetical protein